MANTYNTTPCRSTVGENTDSAYDSKSSSVITLSNGIVLYLREVTKYEYCLLRYTSAVQT